MARDDERHKDRHRPDAAPPATTFAATTMMMVVVAMLFDDHDHEDAPESADRSPPAAR